MSKVDLEGMLASCKGGAWTPDNAAELAKAVAVSRLAEAIEKLVDLAKAEIAKAETRR